jgi:hypothetical protein
MKQLSTLEIGLGTTVETQNDASKNTCETDDKNQTKTQFISSQVFYRTSCERVQETTDWAQLKLKNLNIFDLVAQEQYRLHL